MKIAYFDCFSGISGDMVVGALIHAGVPLEIVRNGLAQLPGLPDSLRYQTRTIVRSAIHAIKFDVLDASGAPVDRGLGENGAEDTGHHHDRDHVHRNHHHHDHEHQHHDHHGDHHSHDHGHGHGHYHSHDHHHGHHHEQSHEHDHADHRHVTFAHIVEMIGGSGLAAGVKERSIAIFHAIAVGEARVHNMAVEQVHFHEVGAWDSIADIVAAAICLEHLGVERVYSSPIPLGSGGTIRTQHGVMPLPAPATLEILKGYPVRLTNVPYELTTPTGAGIVRALSAGTLESEELHVEAVGFGAGTRELPDRPNLLRVAIGTLATAEEQDTAVLMEANIDDMNPQMWPHVIERALEAGALDAWLTPVLMKKGRPGHILSILAARHHVDELTALLWRETTTIGVRYSTVSRRKLKREEVVVDTRFGPVRMKLVEGPDGITPRPEADEAMRIAREHSLPLRDVLDELSRR